MHDGSYLAHHGVQGMKWGVHNDETKRKYGELGPIGRKTVLEKGTEIRRITNREEAKNFDTKRSIYATTNDADFKRYAAVADLLPSVWTEKEKASILTMKLKEDAKFADGKAAVELALEKALKKDISKFEKTLEKTGYTDQIRRAYMHWVDEYKREYGSATMQQVLNTAISDLDPKKMKAAMNVVHVAVTGSIGSFAEPQYLKGYVEKAKKKGYDVVVDPEDWSQTSEPYIKDVKEPIIVLEPSKSLESDYKVDEVKIEKLIKMGEKG